MKLIHILLVEDNEGDILLTTEAIEEGKIANKISVVKDGTKAIEFLSRHAKADLPDLILLDINLPRKNGFEVLRHIKRSEHLKQIPVIMLTTSSAEKDMLYSFENLANGYISKPVEVDDFVNTISEIRDLYNDFMTIREMN